MELRWHTRNRNSPIRNKHIIVLVEEIMKIFHPLVLCLACVNFVCGDSSFFHDPFETASADSEVFTFIGRDLSAKTTMSEVQEYASSFFGVRDFKMIHWTPRGLHNEFSAFPKAWRARTLDEFLHEVAFSIGASVLTNQNMALFLPIQSKKRMLTVSGEATDADTGLPLGVLNITGEVGFGSLTRIDMNGNYFALVEFGLLVAGASGLYAEKLPEQANNRLVASSPGYEDSIMYYSVSNLLYDLYLNWDIKMSRTR